MFIFLGIRGQSSAPKFHNLSSGMRIISKFQDYYDSALAFGHDAHVVFDRKESEYIMTANRRMFSGTKHNTYPKEYDFMKPILKARGSHRKGFDFSFEPFTVAFCGKVYCGIKVSYRKGSMGEWSSTFVYDITSYTELLTKYGVRLDERQDNSRWSWEPDVKGSALCEKDVETYFARAGEDHVTFFAGKRKPIAICEREDGSVHNHRLRFNAPMSGVAFYKVLDPYTAFQELDMFIGGIMSREENPMAGISDEDLRDKKGFDKMSFKTPPTKRR